jgi:hypothetical protein
LGEQIAGQIRARAFPVQGAGRDAGGKPFSPYSTRPTYVSKNSPPRDPDMKAPRGYSLRSRVAPQSRRPGAGRTSREAKSVFYAGGYSQYRQSVGLSSGAAKNLRMSGKTARALRIVTASRTRIVIEFPGRQGRADLLNRRYGFMGLTREEQKRATLALERVIRLKLARRGR